jgi:plastocyanin
VGIGVPLSNYPPCPTKEPDMHRSLSRAVVLATVLAVAMAVAACGSSSSSPAPTTAPSAAPAASAPAASPAGGGGGGNAVTIQNFAFGPATLEVPVGTTVTWTNQDSASHTVTADDGSFDSKSLATGATFTQTFSTAGTFAYHCSIHTSMKATVTVK